jgi:hypothetical protein
MASTLNKRMNDLIMLNSDADFVEFQVHDDLKHNISILDHTPVQTKNFAGYFTIHGEGETDQKSKIRFCSKDSNERKQYVSESIFLYSSVLNYLYPKKVSRIILHPDGLSHKISRREQIELLVMSLTEIAEKIKGIDCVCIEPRGGDRHKKVLRLDIKDIQILQQYLELYSKKEIGLCIDIAQLFVIYGNSGTADFLNELRSIRIPIRELHISDVLINRNVKNRVAMEIGIGSINWKLILPLVLEHCNDLLIETLGGIKVFQRSKAFLESLLKQNGVT